MTNNTCIPNRYFVIIQYLILNLSLRKIISVLEFEVCNR